MIHKLCLSVIDWSYIDARMLNFIALLLAQSIHEPLESRDRLAYIRGRRINLG